MLYFIVICQLSLIIAQDLEKKYEKLTGLQQFSIKNLTKNPFPELLKIIVTLTYVEGDYPILIFCSNKPSNIAFNNYDLLLKENCFADFNAYDEENELQVISIQSHSSLNNYEKNYNIFTYSGQDQYFGAYSQSQSTYTISAQIIKSYNCAKDCQNGGSCSDGICQCLEGYFGDDCRIIGLNIMDQTSLNPIQLYYLDLTQISGTTFLKILSKSIPLSQWCYLDQPYINHAIQFVSNLIQLDSIRLDNCKNNTQQFQSQMQFTILPYYVFKIFSDYEVQILMTESGEDNSSQQILLIVFTPLSFLLLLLIFCCCYKFHKENLKKEEMEKQIQIEKIPTYIDIYMPSQKYYKIKETEELLYQDGQFCSICLEKYEELSSVKVTYCKHIFHSSCLSAWLKKLKGCPLCRANLDQKTVAAMTPQKSVSLFDQITNKSASDKQMNMFKVPTLNSLTSLNNNGQKNQQNNQRSLAYIDS